jgi:hypothetical protein
VPAVEARDALAGETSSAITEEEQDEEEEEEEEGKADYAAAWFDRTNASTTACLSGLQMLLKLAPWRGPDVPIASEAARLSMEDVIESLESAGLLRAEDVEPLFEGASTVGSAGQPASVAITPNVLLQAAAKELEERPEEVFEGLALHGLSPQRRSAAIRAASEWVTARAALLMSAAVLARFDDAVGRGQGGMGAPVEFRLLGVALRHSVLGDSGRCEPMLAALGGT